MYVPQFASEVYQQVIYNFILTRFIQNDWAKLTEMFELLSAS